MKQAVFAQPDPKNLPAMKKHHCKGGHSTRRIHKLNPVFTRFHLRHNTRIDDYGFQIVAIGLATTPW